MSPLDGGLPWIGGVFTVRVDNLGTGPGNSLAFGIVGDSTSTWGAVSLPLDLGFAGMAGCTLYTNPVLTIPLRNVAGTATWPIAIPGDRALTGVPLHLQAGVTSPGANVLGVVMGNLTTLQIGEK